jgi:hypothetical protein
VATCAKPLGDDTNNPDNAGPDPGEPQPRPRLREPATWVRFLSVLQHDAGPGRLLVAAGRPYIPNTTNRFGGSAHAAYGPLRAISYPAAPFGAATKRFNDFRSTQRTNPCPAG